MRRTRAAIADELFETVCHGPAFDDQESRETYRLWSTTWVIHKMFQLIPEMAKRHKAPPMTRKPDAFWDEKPGHAGFLCTGCGNDMKRDWTYCPYCGAQGRSEKAA